MFLKRNYFDRATACNATQMIAKAFFVRHSVRLSMASAVTPSEKSSIITNRKSTTVYALSNEPEMNIVRCPQAPQMVAQKCKLSKV